MRKERFDNEGEIRPAKSMELKVNDVTLFCDDDSLPLLLPLRIMVLQATPCHRQMSMELFHVARLLDGSSLMRDLKESSASLSLAVSTTEAATGACEL